MTVLLRRQAGHALEGFEKIEVVVEAERGGGVADGVIAGVEQLLGLFDADGIEQVVIALLFYCISRIRVRGSINFPNRQCCQFKAVNLMQNSL